jgi:hypothetical protein
MDRDEELDATLGAYALDAVTDDERAIVEAYLDRTPAARTELQRLIVAVDALATSESETPLPNDTWARIEDAIQGTDDAAEGLLPPLRLPADPSAPAAVVAIDRRDRPAAPGTPRRPSRGRGVVAAALAIAAALVVGIGIGGVIGRHSHRSSNGTLSALAAATLDDPASRTATMSGSASGVRAVVGPHGQGYVFADSLPALPPGRTYQLWSLDGATPVSLAVLGARPAVASFPAGPSVGKLAITNEAAPGATAPTASPVAEGTLS